MPIKKDIIYPIFIQCCPFTCDNFWELIFEDLAYGKCPYGTYISKNFLCCSYKNKEFSYKIEKKDPEILYTEIYTLLTDKLGLLSHSDKIQKKKAFMDLEDLMKDSRKTWADIRKKNIRELMLELYVTKMKIKHSLSLKQAKHLLSIIFIAMVFKVITNNDIYYENGRIKYIEGIDFAKKQVIIKKNLYQLDVSFAPNIIMDKKLMVDNWEKYLKDLRKISSNGIV
jgi:hypothetical protein